MSEAFSTHARNSLRGALILRLPALRLGGLAIIATPVVVALSVILAGWDAAAVMIAIAVYFSGALLTVIQMQRTYPHDVVGFCNVVTLLRFVMVATLCAPLLGNPEPWVTLAVAVVILTLDGLDGWLARWQGVVSDFGARFDMEVDSAFALILALNVWAYGHAGAMVLLLGMPRYAFVVATWVWPWLDRPVPDRFSRKLACVLQIAALIALLSPIVAVVAGTPVMIAAITILGLSFAHDIIWLHRHKRNS